MEPALTLPLMFAGGFFALVFIVTAVIILMYNTLISRRNQVKNAFASVDVMLKRRYDLIPNLVEAVKGYMKHESGVLTEVTKLRAQAVNPGISDSEKLSVASRIAPRLKTLLLNVENYPNLKANQNFLNLQAALTDTEEQISAARRAYNASVMDYNNAVEMLPTSIIAGLMGFKRMDFFEAEGSDRKVPENPKEFSK